MPKFEMVDEPPPGPAPKSRPTRAPQEVYRPPTPPTYVPTGTPPAPGTAWPPPEGDPTVCLVRDKNKKEITTKCGRYIKVVGNTPEYMHASIWESNVTCKRCKPDA